MKSSRKCRPRRLHFELLEPRAMMAANVTAALNSGVLTVTGTDSDDLINFRQIGKNISIVGVSGSWTETKVKSIVVDLKGGNDTVSINSWANGGTKALAEAVTVKAGAGNEKVQLANNQQVNFSGAPNALSVSAAGVASMNGVALNFGSSIVPSYKSGVLTITGTNSGESIKFLQANGWIGIQGRTEWWSASSVISIIVNLQEGNDSVSLASLSNGGNQALAAAITVNSGQGNQTVRLANGFDVNLSGWGHQLNVSTSGVATLDGQTLNFTGEIQTSFANGILTISGKNTADDIKLLQADGWIGIQGCTAWWAKSAINSIVVNLGGGDDALSLASLSNGGNQAFSTSITINSGGGNETVRLADGHSVNFNGIGHQLTVSATGAAVLDGRVLDVNSPAPTSYPPANILPASYATTEDTPVKLAGISITDRDAATATMAVTLNVGSGKLMATSGSGVTVAGSGSGTITLTGALANLNKFLSSAAPVFNPAANANGAVTLTMTTSDSGNLTDVDIRTITVTPVNDPPIAANDSFTTNEDTAVSTTVLSNDSDAEGNPLKITKVNGTAIVAGGAAVAVANGTVKLNAAGTQLTLTPATNFNGSVSYTYTISDGQGGTSTATVTGTVTPVDDPPVTNWFDTNIHDAALRSLGHNLYLDGLINRTDIVALLRNTQDGGVVDATELADLRKIVTNTTLVGTQAHLLTLTSYIVNGSVANAKYQGANLGNLAAGSTGTQLEKLINKWFLGLDRPTASGTYRQFAGQLFVNGATYDDIHQGSLGDCYFVMALAEVALRSPTTITNMFVVNGDGTYTVRFYTPTGQMDYVTVDSYLPTDSNGRLFYATRGALYTNKSNELWVALAEKAYAQLNELGWSRTGFVESGQNSYAGIDSGYAYVALNHVTGLSTVAFTMTASSNSFSAFVTAYQAGKMIGFATYVNPPTSGIVSNHVYAVVGYNATDQTVTLFNPWGIEFGLVTMTWSQITANFMYYDRTA